MQYRRYRFGYFVAVVAALAWAGCGGGGAGTDFGCDPLSEPCLIEKDVSTITVGAGVEDEDICQSWTLGNDTELWVTGITQNNNGAYHHANWFFVPDDTYVLPDGTWSCNDNRFDELTAAILGGYLFALSTQSLQETQTIPAGGAIRIPPYSRIIGSSHVINASDQDVTSTMHIALDTVPPDQVAASMAPGRIQYHDLTIDPLGRSSFTTDCLVGDNYEDVMGEPWEYVLYYALSHYHELGFYSELAIIGGDRDGEVIIHHDGFGENFGQAIDPPLDLAAIGARGMRFTCGYDNPRNAEVKWGIGDQEMCVLALQAKTNMAFDGTVGTGRGEMIEVAPDGEIKYAGPCSILGIPWDHAKPGGQ